MIRSQFLANSKLLVEPSFRPGFLTLRARLIFAKLRYVFIKILILYHFDLKWFILFKTNALGYTIGKVLS